MGSNVQMSELMEFHCSTRAETHLERERGSVIELCLQLGILVSSDDVKMIGDTSAYVGA